MKYSITKQDRNRSQRKFFHQFIQVKNRMCSWQMSMLKKSIISLFLLW